MVLIVDKFPQRRPDCRPPPPKMTYASRKGVRSKWGVSHKISREFRSNRSRMVMGRRPTPAAWLVLSLVCAVTILGCVQAAQPNKDEGLDNMLGQDSFGGLNWEAKATRIAESISLPKEFYKAFKEAAKVISEMCIGTPRYTRPSRVGNPENYEGYFEGKSLIPGGRGRIGSIKASAEMQFPWKRMGAGAPGRDVLGAAVRLAVNKVMKVSSKELVNFRKSQLMKIKAALAPTAQMTAEVRRIRNVPGTVQAVAGGVNIVAMAVITLAVNWPDELLAQGLLEGFRVVGILQDTGVFRSIQPRQPLEAFQAVWRENMSQKSTLARVHDVARNIELKAKSMSEQNVEDCRILAKRADDEMREKFCSKKMSLADVVKTAAQQAIGRVMRRFLIRNRGKPRPIDDGHESGTNECTLTYETITLPSPAWLAVVARACHGIAGEMTRNMGRAARVPRLMCGLEDVHAAYRRAPCCQPGHTLVGFWNPDPAPGAVEFRCVHGHPFGCVGSVLNWSRIPAFECWAGALILSIPSTAYIDDFIFVDKENTEGNAQRSMSDFIKELGMPGFAANKHVHASPESRVLGTIVDMSKAHCDNDPHVLISPVPERCEELLQDLRKAQERGTLSPQQAASMAGRLHHVLSSVFGNLGRAVMFPLYERGQGRGEGAQGSIWTDALQNMLYFLEAVLVAGAIKPRRMAMCARKERHCSLWTDAAGNGGLGVVFEDPETGVKIFASARCPEWVYDKFDNKDRSMVINQLEAYAALCGLLTVAEIAQGRQMMFVIDNTSCLCSLVKGYSRVPDLRRMTGMCHALIGNLNMEVFFDWVASKDNPADLPSRLEADDCKVLLEEGFKPVVMCMPTEEQWGAYVEMLRLEPGPVINVTQ
jgi:hypothetical protein